ncbi:MAG: hypothetical protein ACREOQ_01905 [Gemmatimonadales bacterium]
MIRRLLGLLSGRHEGGGGPPAADHRVVHGFPVRIVNTRPDIDTEQVIQRLTAALDLIATYAPRRYRRLRHDVAGFVVERFACRGAFFPQSRECLVELTFTVNPRHGLPEIAASIVHEATHARVAHMCRTRSPAQGAREERLCRRVELELGLALPDGAVVVQRARDSLALADREVAPAVDWAEAQRRVAAADAQARGRSGTG